MDGSPVLLGWAVIAAAASLARSKSASLIMSNGQAFKTVGRNEFDKEEHVKRGN
jgi:hypothetical protein